MICCLTRESEADAELLLEHPQMIAVGLHFVNVRGEQAVMHIMLHHLQESLQRKSCLELPTQVKLFIATEKIQLK